MMNATLRSRFQGSRLFMLFAMALAVALALPLAAFADTVALDGDGVSTSNSKNSKFLLCEGAGSSVDVFGTINYSGEGKGAKHFKNNGTVTITTSVASAASGFITAEGGSVTTSSWDDNQDTVTTSAMRLLVDTDWVAGTYEVTYTFTGKDQDGKDYVETDKNNVEITKKTTGCSTDTGGGTDGGDGGSTPPPPPAANTAPTVDVTYQADGKAFANDQKFEIGSVPTASCYVNDAEDTGESATPVVSAITGTLSAYGLGSQTVTCSYTDSGGLNGEDSVTYTIVDTGAPTISDLGPVNSDGSLATADGSNGWFISEVTNKFQASDTGAGFQTDTPKLLQYDFTKKSGTNDGSAVKISSGSVSDVAGNPAMAKEPTFKIDLTDPKVEHSVPAANAAGWYNADVTVSLSATDRNAANDADGSGVKEIYYSLNNGASYTLAPSAEYQTSTSAGKTTTSFQFPVSSEGITDIKYYVKDDAGRSSSIGALTVKLDETAPVISDNGVKAGTAGSNGWYTSAVTNEFKASDGLSGFSGKQDPHTFTVSSTGEGSAVSISSGTVSDLAGNESNSVSKAFKIDLSKPLLGITDNNSATYNVCSSSKPSKPAFNPSDAISDIDWANTSESWTNKLAASGVGEYTYSAKATDMAGLSESYGPKTYKVQYGDSLNGGSGAYGGVLQPINGGGTSSYSDDDSRFKVGSTVPVKFKLMCGTTSIDNAVAKLHLSKQDSQPDSGYDEAVSTAASTTGNLFRYDATNQQYIFNLSTKSSHTNPDGTTVTPAAGTWYLWIMLDDGSSRSIKIQFTK